MEILSLRPVEDGDLPLLTRWLHQDYILKWYENSEDWLLELEERHGRFAFIRHFIVMDGDIPMGFCQYYDCYDARELEDWYTVHSPGDIYSLDYLIGERSYLGKGYGKAIVSLITKTVSHRENARRIVVQPDRDNEASCGVLLANGYVYDEGLGYFYQDLW